eukprot:gene12379-biopygen13317
MKVPARVKKNTEPVRVGDPSRFVAGPLKILRETNDSVVAARAPTRSPRGQNGARWGACKRRPDRTEPYENLAESESGARWGAGQSSCSAVAQQVQRSGTAAALQLHCSRSCTAVAAALQLHSSCTALATAVAQQLHCSCTAVAQRLQCSCTAQAEQLHCNCTAAAP